jgi:hypothetical protein
MKINKKQRIPVLAGIKLSFVFSLAMRAWIFIICCFFVSSCAHQQRAAIDLNSYYGPMVDTILNHSEKIFNETSREGITFYYEADPYFNKHIEQLINDAISAKKICAEKLGNINIPYQIKVIYFNDREKIRPYLNMAPKGIALPDAYTLLIATNDSIRAYHTHEMMHIISIDHFGGYAAVPGDWIQEGMSVYTDNPCLGYPIHEIAAYLLYAKKMPSLDSLFNQFRTLPDVAAYMTAGSLVWFLRDVHGVEKFKKLWKEGIGKLTEIYQLSIYDLESEYHQFLKKNYPKQPTINWDLLNEKGCG